MAYSDWALTVKILVKIPLGSNPKVYKEKIIQDHYEPFFKNLYSHASSIYMLAEMDSHNLLHYHGVIQLPLNFYRKKLKVQGFHFKLKRLFNFHGWWRYIHKDYMLGPWDKSIYHKVDLECKEKITITPIKSKYKK